MNQMNRFELSVGHTMACGRVLPAQSVHLAIKATLAAENILNLTMQDVTGFWLGCEERTTVVTVIEPVGNIGLMVEKFEHVAARLAAELHQECVMLTHSVIGCSFVKPAEEN